MNELIRTSLKKRKNGKKGFTLVELIVVLVILAILAAILIPAMTGWMRKAENKGAIIEARTIKVAIQTLVSENYKTVASAAGTDTTIDTIKVANQAGTEEAIKLAAQELAETGTDAAKGVPTRIKISATNEVTFFTYETKEGDLTVTYDASKTADKAFTVKKK